MQYFNWPKELGQVDEDRDVFNYQQKVLYWSLTYILIFSD